MKKSPSTTAGLVERPPVVVVMGHVDHGKSTLLDYIRKSNVAEKEIGGITQKIGAYEVEHVREGETKRITFIDTPGHEAFQSIRARGAKTADIAILVVSAEDGVKPQTIQALKTILAEDMPYIVAINKIDKDGADIDRTKQTLAEHEVYLEGYGGNIPVVAVSAKTGKGIPELLEMILLVADLEELKADPSLPGSGIVIETQVDKKRGNTATVIITSGTIHSGEAVVAGTSLSPVRIFENFAGKAIKEATFSSPVRIIGWDTLPGTGELFSTLENKRAAETLVEERRASMPASVRYGRPVEQKQKAAPASATPSDPTSTKVAGSEAAGPEVKMATLPLIIKASEMGALEAVMHEISKIKHDAIVIKIVHSGVGDINEHDLKTATSVAGTLVVGFGVNIDTPARALADSLKTTLYTFDIIYKLSEWLGELVKERAPKKMIEKMTGRAKILKKFSRTKDKEVIGGKVEEGMIKSGSEIKILRRENEIGRGHIRELRRQKDKVSSIEEGNEFGGMIEASVELVPGDRIECFVISEE